LTLTDVTAGLKLTKPSFSFGFYVITSGDYYIWSWSWTDSKMKSWIKVNGQQYERGPQGSGSDEKGPFRFEANRVYPIEMYLEKEGTKGSQIQMKWRGPGQASMVGSRVSNCEIANPRHGFASPISHPVGAQTAP
jgi:hypothetical protein